MTKSFRRLEQDIIIIKFYSLVRCKSIRARIIRVQWALVSWESPETNQLRAMRRMVIHFLFILSKLLLALWCEREILLTFKLFCYLNQSQIA